MPQRAHTRSYADVAGRGGSTTLPSLVSAVRRIAGLLLVVLAAAACGSDEGTAAVVDGTSITHQDVVDELVAIRGNETYVEAVESQGGPVLGTIEDSFDTAFVASQLSLRIRYLLVANETERRGLEADTECRAAAQSSLTQQLAGASPDGDGAAVLDGFADGYRNYLIDREAAALLLQGDLIEQPCVADDAVGAYYEAHQEDFEQACASHILVPTQDEAAEVVTELRSGGDFAALALEHSTDSASAQQGGSIGCVPAGAVPSLDAALFSQPIGAVGDPVQTEFGFHVLRVDSRAVPPLTDIRDAVSQRFAEEVREAFRVWYVDALAAADVTVDPRYGTWNASDGLIERPAATGTTTSSTAVPVG